MVEKEKSKTVSIKCDIELIEILDRLDPKLKEVTWGAVDKVSYAVKTKILARKIKASKLNF